MEKRNNKVLVVLGPTSSGKSEVAIKLAKKFNGEVISADSRQIYRGMDIGTGKITKKEMRGVKHWMLDIVSPKTDYNVAKFKKQADKIIEDILERGKLPIICGGTGFWIKAIVDNVDFPEVAPNKKLRNKLHNYSAERLFNMLKKLDSKRARSIDKNNKVRLIRAIEICKTLDKVPSIDNAKGSDPYAVGVGPLQFLQIGIDIPKEKLQENIKRRLKERFKNGMIQEVKVLREKYKLSWKKIQSFGLGYFWIPLFLQKKISREELFEKVYLAEKNYAKRQMTWFKKDQRINWLKDYKEIEKETKNFTL
ncbi:MAG: tRNA (adenosine(37)-N6)-dimethylallyltransferase MiaA [Parcubacteria group bacterium]